MFNVVEVTTKFSGHIPDSIGDLERLIVLDVIASSAALLTHVSRNGGTNAREVRGEALLACKRQSRIFFGFCLSAKARFRRRRNRKRSWVWLPSAASGFI
ncbi:hypothetical protein MA16_Dca001686 [Dendrobium catenatum]|uniref:Uncharacterized protein n=1 Tax=Dendrobium catenatum TaxID=906689 RepID=A0A2I0WN39_9ASPA|nr:hypothetical protein MA16_Dca001686 [Dendrobium catenatum]